MLIESKLEVHTHHSKIITLSSQYDVEWGISIGLLIETEDCFWISEDVGRSNESIHGSLYTLDGCFSGDGSRGSLRV